MLTEFALTPEVFEEDHNAADPAWRERIRALGQALFPPNAAAATIIANLFDGSWMHALGHVVDATTTPATADLLRSLRTMLAKACVTRPARCEYPMNEHGWITEAEAFVSDAPIDRLVSSDALAAELGANSSVHGLSGTSAPGFWDNTGPVRHPRMDIAAQMDLLRPVCLHASFVAFTSPHIRSVGSGDFDFTTELIGRFVRRPSGFPRARLIDIHTKGLVGKGEREDQARRILEGIRERLRTTGVEIRLFLWPTLLDRVLLAGEVGDARRLRVRWGFSFTHVARPAIDGPDADPATWAMMLPSHVARWRHRLYGGAASSQPGTRDYPAGLPFSESPYVLGGR